MAIQPSTSETRGRSLVSKPLSASDGHIASETSDECPDLSPEDGEPDPLLCSVPNEEVHLPNDDDASPESVPNVEHDNIIKSRDFASDSEFWAHLSTTLDECFSPTKSSNEAEPDTISNDPLADAPRVIQTFLSHGEACTKIETEALDLVSNGPVSHVEDEPLKVYRDLLDDLEHLQERATSLEMSISRLAGLVHRDEDEQHELAGSKLALRSELERVFTACLPVLRARKANLTVAQDLIDTAQEDFSVRMRMEYLGID